MKKQTLVVIDNGMVGQKLLKSLSERQAQDQYEIVTFCEEPRPAYDRVHLSEFFSGKTAADLSIVTDEFFIEKNITIHIGDKAERIDREAKQIISTQGKTIPYDKLVLATGSYPFVPPRFPVMIEKVVSSIALLKTWKRSPLTANRVRLVSWSAVVYLDWKRPMH